MIPPATAAALAREVVTWRDEARAAFASSRSAEGVRDAFRRLWRRAEGAEEDDLLAIMAEFRATLERYGEGGVTR
jgi:hypothetical protein